MRSLLVLVLLMVFGDCNAQETCKPGRPMRAASSELVVTTCVDANKYTTRKYVSIDNAKILEDSYLSEEEFNDESTIWIFRGEGSIETGCARRLYLVDLSTKPVKVIAFGVKNACNDFHWASWGKKRSVIALKKNVKFIYENGKMMLPKKGASLFANIEPPHSSRGEPLTEESAIPFAEDVPTPKQ